MAGHCEDIGWWRKPCLRDEEIEGRERKASWLELFYDLIYVAIVAELTHTLAHHVTWAGIGEFVIFFIPTLWAWIGAMAYNERFDTDDASHRWFTFLKMLPVAVMAIFVHRGLEDGAIGFALAFAASRDWASMASISLHRKARPGGRARTRRGIRQDLRLKIAWRSGSGHVLNDPRPQARFEADLINRLSGTKFPASRTPAQRLQHR